MIVVYYSSVSSNTEIKKQQQKIQMILDSKKIEYTLLDISASEDDKKAMREKAGSPTALPPQICNGDQYCGDFEAFDVAIEEESLQAFLKLDKTNEDE